MDKKGLGALIIAVVALLIMGAIGFMPVLSHNIAVQHNEPVDATVTSTDIEVTEDDDGDKKYNPVVTYQYTVDGQTYSSDNTFPGGTTRKDGDRGWAEDVISSHPEGSETTVYYRPGEPDKSYLTNTDGWPDSWFVGVGAIGLGVIAGLWLIWLGFKRWRQRNLMVNTPTESVQALSIGPSEIKGTAITEERDPLPAPFTEEECVLAKYEVKQYDEGDDDDAGSWDTVESDTVYKPFHVDDGTGTVLVKPHEETTYELDPEDWTETYVDSSGLGPERIQQFVKQNPDLSFPADRSGRENDRKYRQNLIRDGESVYIFGTTQPREDSSGYGGSNEDRLVIKKVEDDALSEPMYLISDDEEEDLTSRRQFALWRLPVGVVFFGVAFFMTLGMLGPLFGLTIPAWF